MIKNIILLLIPLCLTSCGDTISSEPQGTLIFEKAFTGYKDNELAFFNEGFMAGECRFDDNCLKLLRKNGFVRTPVLNTISNKYRISLKTHITGLNTLTDEAIGQTTSFRIEGLKKMIENDDISYIVVDAKEYSHLVTEEDKNLGYLSDFPMYTSDFSSSPYEVILSGEEITNIRITFLKEVTYQFEGKEAGCNLAINAISVYNL